MLNRTKKQFKKKTFSIFRTTWQHFLTVWISYASINIFETIIFISKLLLSFWPFLFSWALCWSYFVSQSAFLSSYAVWEWFRRRQYFAKGCTLCVIQLFDVTVLCKLQNIFLYWFSLSFWSLTALSLNVSSI